MPNLHQEIMHQHLQVPPSNATSVKRKRRSIQEGLAADPQALHSQLQKRRSINDVGSIPAEEIQRKGPRIDKIQGFGPHVRLQQKTTLCKSSGTDNPKYLEQTPVPVFSYMECLQDLYNLNEKRIEQEFKKQQRPTEKISTSSAANLEPFIESDTPTCMPVYLEYHRADGTHAKRLEPSYNN